MEISIKNVNRLKNLYTNLIVNNFSNISVWHDQCESFVNKINELKEKDIESIKKETNLLRALIYEKNNGISSRGQSVLSEKNYNSLIQEDKFIEALCKFINEDSKDNYELLKNTWNNIAEAKNFNRTPLLINRVVAACSNTVSTTVDNSKFERVFDWLIDNNLIEIKNEISDESWFSKNTALINALNDCICGKNAKEYDEVSKRIFIWMLYEYITMDIKAKKQIIKYGPPGTGKSFLARKQARDIFNVWKDEFINSNSNSEGKDYFSFEKNMEFIQFHPSYTYEDFIEGIRPQKTGNGSFELKLTNGIFKEFCKKAGVWEIDLFELGEKFTELTLFDIQNIRDDNLKGNHWDYIRNYISSIPESSLKDIFIKDVIPPFFFIIDEINRAELSRVLGELMYCLEYRGVEGRVKTQYSMLNTDETSLLKINGEYEFFIPSNIYIIGTMNTIDRSVESFDFALRRRFNWQEVLPDSCLLRNYLRKSNDKWEELADKFDRLNEEIKVEPLLGTDFQIGHAYLMNLEKKYSKKLKLKDISRCVWDDSIKPLLEEYIRGTGKEQELLDFYRKKFIDEDN